MEKQSEICHIDRKLNRTLQSPNDHFSEDQNDNSGQIFSGLAKFKEHDNYFAMQNAFHKIPNNPQDTDEKTTMMKNYIALTY